MRSVLTRNRFTVVVLAGVLAVGVVSPAVGGPSLGKLVDKALNKSDKAIKKARKNKASAQRASEAAAAAAAAAQAAQEAADAAQDSADLALSRELIYGTDTDDTNTSITAGVTSVMDVEITIPYQANVIATSTVEVDADGGNNDDAFCYLNKGGTGSLPDDISQRVTNDIPDTNLDRTSIVNIGNVVLAPGTHKIRVFCGVNVGGQSIDFDSGDMFVVAIPTPLP